MDIINKFHFIALNVIRLKHLKVHTCLFPAILDPFVRVELICGGKRIKKKRTSTKRNTLNPTWNEALVFNLHGKELSGCGGGGSATTSGGVTSSSFPASGSGPTGNAIQQGFSGSTSLPGVQLEMTVFNDNLLGTNEPLGRMVVGDQANGGPIAAAQWMELMAVRNAPARWHVLQHQQSTGDGC